MEDDTDRLDGDGAVSEDEGVGPVAEWVRSQRDEKGWTVAELAEESGVSIPQIYNLESGRSRNPQSKTRLRLEKAFDAAMPEATPAVEAPGVEPQDVGLGALQDFDPYAESDLPDCSGVYVLYDISDRPVYVGRATKRTIAQRLPEHYEKFWFKRPVVSHAAFISIADEKLCMQIESVLIRFLKSNAVLNRQHVSR